MARRLVEREARSGCQPARQHPPVQDLHEFAATASPRRATRCDARVPEQPPVLRQRIQKNTGTTPDLGGLAPRPSRRPTRGPQSRAKPRVTPLVTISDWRYLLRRHHVTTPAVWAGRLPLKGLRVSGAHRSCTRVDLQRAASTRWRRLLAAVYDAKALSEARR